MHEMSLVRDVVDTVLAACDGLDVVRVESVTLTIGELSDAVVSYIPELFKYLARGTLAADAEVVINRSPALMRCEDCGEIYPVSRYGAGSESWACPRCGAGTRVALFSGREFRIDRIEARVVGEDGDGRVPGEHIPASEQAIAS